MKKTLAIALILVTSNSFAQLTKPDVKGRAIGRVERSVGIPEIRLTETIAEVDTSYSISYKNLDNPQSNEWRMIIFKGRQTIDNLYDALRDAFKKKKGEESTFVLGNITVRLHTGRSFGVKWIDILLGSGRTLIYERDLASLFANYKHG